MKVSDFKAHEAKGEDAEILTYDAVDKILGTGTRHLLLGNGFSIACDKQYAYGALFDYAKTILGERVTPAFDRLGTNNFEGVMRLLHEASWLAEQYGAPEAAIEMRQDLELVKTALVAAVAETHLDRPQAVGDDRLNRCVQFLNPYTNIFTVCYDLLLYWVAMHGLDVLKERDGFRNSVDDPDATYCVFREHIRGQKGILFIHGALHIYVEGGEVRKHTYVKSGVPLVDLIRDGLKNDQIPLFVAEGDPANKRSQILHNGYLDYCFGKLMRIENPLVTFGFSFGPTDAHIVDVLVTNPKLAELCIGVHNPMSDEGKRTIATGHDVAARRTALLDSGFKGKPLKVRFYESASCHVWD